MTLSELKLKADALKIGGRVLPDNSKFKVVQDFAFDNILQICDPLNLAIPYRDNNILRPVDNIDEWYLRAPNIAKEDGDYIDIDSRLDMAFVYYVAAFFANDEEKVVFEHRANRACLEYACSVLDMGLPKAKEVYELESFVTNVRFDCVGKMYIIDEDFVKLVIECLLCNGVCMNSAENKRLEFYKIYLAGGSIKPVDFDSVRAIDIAVFLYIMNNLEEYKAYSAEQLSRVTTLSCEFEKLANGEAVEQWVLDLDKRLYLSANKG